MRNNNAALLSKLKQAIKEEIDDVYYNAAEGLYQYANAIAETAKALAPIDTGTLEESIHVEIEEIDGTSVILHVVADAEQNGKSYAREASENLPPAPNAEWELGKKSEEKARSTNMEVGGEFIERAIIMTEFDMGEYIKRAMNK